MHNQRYFFFFVFWCVVSTVDGMLHLTPYLYRVVWPHVSALDLLPTVSWLRWGLGYISLFNAFFCFIYMTFAALFLISCIMFYQISVCTLFAMTSFEVQKQIKVRDSRDVRTVLRETLGEDWGLSLLVPWRRRGQCREDAVRWPSVAPE